MITNQKLFLAINSYANIDTTIDFFMVSIAEYMPYVFIGLLFYLWFTNKQNEALYAGYATTLGIVINAIIGLFYFHPRPFMDSLGVTLVSHKAENSFPSDHTTFVVSIAFMLLTFKSTRTIGIIASILALWCGVARVYCGVHYPFDIVGSIIVSTVATITIKLLAYKLKELNISIISLWSRILNIF